MDIKAKIKSSGGPDIAAKEMRNLVQGASVAAVRTWHRDFAPEHFKPSAMSRYGYQKRTKKYMMRKARQKRHQDPLVWTGASKRSALGVIKIVSTAKSARGVMVVPRYFWAYRKDLGASDKANELTRTTPEEQRVLSWKLGQTVEQQLRGLRGTSTRNIA